MAGKGKRFELSVKNGINALTPDSVKAHRPDYSGNSKGEVADIMVVWQANNCGFVEYVELKKRSGVDEGNRKVVMSGSSKGQSGVDELTELVEGSPDWTRQWVGVKFQRRELIVFSAEALVARFKRDDDYCGKHGIRKTRGGNISVVKPELDTWPSTSGGRSDEQKLLDEFGVSY